MNRSWVVPSKRAICAAALLIAAGCTKSAPSGSEADAGEAAAEGPALTLPSGFRSDVVAKDLGRVRHITVRANGDIYANLRQPNATGQSAVALRDTTGDGKADRVEYFSSHGGGTGILAYDGHLYFTSRTEVFRQRWASEDELVPSGATETIVTGLPQQDSHAAKSIAIDGQGRLYVNVGAPSNACQEQSRAPGSPGLNPCPQLERQGSIWRFSATEVGQSLADDGIKHATGLRNVIALAWNPEANDLFGVQHGRDQLDVLFPERFTPKQSSELPAEEFLRLTEGFVGGWPYTYYDGARGKRMVAPEYGGDGETESEAGRYPEPVHAFAAHYAPNGLLFYESDQFPSRYRHGAFVVFRGSWNRGDFGQEGYRVEFLPMQNGQKTGPAEVFADGFAGPGPIRTTRDADFRPTGIAVTPDGSLLVSDTEKGWIWRIRYTGA